jgi:hypothetical protein
VRPAARPKNLATKTVAWPYASAPSIDYSGRGRAARAECLSVYMVRCIHIGTGGRPNVLDKAVPIILRRRERISIYLATLLVSEETGLQLQ